MQGVGESPLRNGEPETMSADRPSWWRVRFPSPEEGTLGEFIGALILLVLLPFVVLWELLDEWRQR